MSLETLWTGGSCLLWPASRCKEEILIYEEHAFPPQRGIGLIKIPSVAAFGVGSLTWITYRLIWLFYSGRSVPESVNTAAVKDKCHLLHWAYITSLLLCSECFCNLHHLKFPFITKPHISLTGLCLDICDNQSLRWRSGWLLQPVQGILPQKQGSLFLCIEMVELFWGSCNSPWNFILCLSKFLFCHQKWKRA